MSRKVSESSDRVVMKVKKLYSDACLPRRASAGSSGLDLFAYIKDESRSVQLQGKPTLIGTGIAIEVPRGYDVQIRPRSGLSARGIVTAFGTIDSDYRGELKVTLYTLGNDATFVIKHGDRIAQLVISKLADLSIAEVEKLSLTARDGGGHGSTGLV